MKTHKRDASAARGQGDMQESKQAEPDPGRQDGKVLWALRALTG